LIYQLKDNFGFAITEIIDLSYFEREDKYLEGTGSMILDRVNKIAYACLSSRTHPEVLKVFCDKLGYTPHTFHAVNDKGVPVYHTNVLMALGESFAIICLDAIQDENERNALVEKLEKTGKMIIPITYRQMLKFAGNMLQVNSEDDKEILVMSDNGYHSLTDEQYDALYNRTGILHADLNCIETYGGGSARCMMAEIFCPKTEE
ncbi:MAG: arginine deiminase-related protein, partial [Bacteroidia bacterium]